MHSMHLTHIGDANEDCEFKAMANSNSFRGLLQQGLRSGGKLSGGNKLEHGDANFRMTVCNESKLY